MAKHRAPATENPLPTTLEDALVEIVALQRQLVEANKKLASRWSDLAIAGRSLKAQLKRAQKKCKCDALTAPNDEPAKPVTPWGL